MDIYSNTTYGMKTFSGNDKMALFDASFLGPTVAEKILAIVAVILTIIGAVTSPLETFITVLFLAVLFS